MNTTHTKIPQILKRVGEDVIFDGHMWLEITNTTDGKIYIKDYKSQQYQGVSAYSQKGGGWTGELDYKPFPAEIENLISNNRIESAHKKIDTAEMFLGEGYKDMVFNTPGFCNIRVAYELDSLSEFDMDCGLEGNFKDVGISYKVRSGSLGFVQNNGDIFYEYG